MHPIFLPEILKEYLNFLPDRSMKVRKYIAVPIKVSDRDSTLWSK